MNVPHCYPWKSLAAIAFLTLLLESGCSGRVDLGGPNQPLTGSTTSPKDPEEQAAGTTVLAEFSAPFLHGIGLDQRYLYALVEATHDSASNYFVYRCDKADCSASWTQIYKFTSSAMVESFNLVGARLNWRDGALGLVSCGAPDCGDVAVTDGATVFTFGNDPVQWDDDFAYFFINDDKSLYRCRVSGCPEGPDVIASKVSTAGPFDLAGEFAYWLDTRKLGVFRVPRDGSRTAERLTLESQTAWTTSPQPTAEAQTITSFAVDETFIYTALSTQGVPPIQLVRWSHTVLGAERQIMLPTVEMVESKFGFRMVVIGDELVWNTGDTTLWSCIADDCSATTRKLGIQARVETLGPMIIGDDQDVYWLSNPSDRSGGTWNGLSWSIKRTPRLTRH